MITGVMLIATVALISAIVVRLMDRRGDGDPKRVQRLEERIARLEGSMEAMSSERERLGVGQRFMTTLLAERSPSATQATRDEPRQ